MQQIRITVDKQGKTTVEAEGFVGPTCTEATRNIIEALGPKKNSEEFKPEMFQEEQQGIENQNG